jgi:hypothetical protein
MRFVGTDAQVSNDQNNDVTANDYSSGGSRDVRAGLA